MRKGKSRNRDKKNQVVTNGHSDYLIGYKKPPQRTQFKPGQSGNARGRPKSITTPADVVRKQLGKKITINVGGIDQKVAVLEAILLKHASLAAAGNHKSTKILLDLFGREGNEQSESLREVVLGLRSVNAAHEAADRIAPRPEKTKADSTKTTAKSENEDEKS
jgi:hypothetical protein